MRSRVEHRERLLGERARVRVDLRAGQRRARRGAAARIADAGRVVADDQHDLVAEVLELPELLEHDRVAEMDVRRGRVDPELDPERALLRELALERPSGRLSTALRASQAAASDGLDVGWLRRQGGLRPDLGIHEGQC